jgi:formylmethanofuran dehydrogenase subunit E
MAGVKDQIVERMQITIPFVECDECGRQELSAYIGRPGGSAWCIACWVELFGGFDRKPRAGRRPAQGRDPR